MPASPVPSLTEEQLLAFGTLLARSGKIIESEISGTSMGRTLPAGTRIRIQPLPAGDYGIGQIVAFVRGSTIFAHRIAYRTKQGVLTRGDNHSWCDLPVPVDAVLGLVTEWWINGEWQRFAEVPQGSPEQPQPWRIRVVESAVRAGMHMDIRLARRISRALMRLARLRRNLRSEISPDGSAQP
jgi:hypothetical protein